jgi:hypothetical protein
MALASSNRRWRMLIIPKAQAVKENEELENGE